MFWFKSEYLNCLRSLFYIKSYFDVKKIKNNKVHRKLKIETELVKLLYGYQVIKLRDDISFRKLMISNLFQK